VSKTFAELRDEVREIASDHDSDPNQLCDMCDEFVVRGTSRCPGCAVGWGGEGFTGVLCCHNCGRETTEAECKSLGYVAKGAKWYCPSCGAKFALFKPVPPYVDPYATCADGDAAGMLYATLRDKCAAYEALTGRRPNVALVGDVYATAAYNMARIGTEIGGLSIYGRGDIWAAIAPDCIEVLWLPLEAPLATPTPTVTEPPCQCGRSRRHHDWGHCPCPEYQP